MKKKVALLLLIALVSTLAISSPSFACKTCGCELKKAVTEAVADASCNCDDKAWYNPLTWFKDCPVCDAKKAACSME